MAKDQVSIGSESVVVAATHQVSVDLGEETLILQLSDAGYYRLRNVAARIWKLLESPVRVSEIGDAIAREYGVSRERAEADAIELLEGLRARRLLDIES